MYVNSFDITSVVLGGINILLQAYTVLLRCNLMLARQVHACSSVFLASILAEFCESSEFTRPFIPFRVSSRVG